MCDFITSETLLKEYFRKYKRKNKISYEALNRIRKLIENDISAYVDVSYSSLRKVESRFSNEILMEDCYIQLLDRARFCGSLSHSDLKHRLEIFL